MWKKFNWNSCNSQKAIRSVAVYCCKRRLSHSSHLSLDCTRSWAVHSIEVYFLFFFFWRVYRIECCWDSALQSGGLLTSKIRFGCSCRFYWLFGRTIFPGNDFWFWVHHRRLGLFCCWVWRHRKPAILWFSLEEEGKIRSFVAVLCKIWLTHLTHSFLPGTHKVLRTAQYWSALRFLKIRSIEIWRCEVV